MKDAGNELNTLKQEYRDFAYAVSHDLSGPLRNIEGFAQLILKRNEEAFDEKTKKQFESMLQAADRGKRLLEAVLEFSRLNTMAKPHIYLNLSRPFENALAILSHQISSSGASIKHPDIWPDVKGEPDQLQMMFYHLLDNSLKFQPEGNKPEISIELEESPEHIVLVVSDNGIGINPELADEVFTIFRTLHPMDKYPGVGGGLALVRKVVQMHDAEAQIMPAAKGACIKLTFPKN